MNFKSISFSAGTVVIGQSIPRQSRVATFNPGFDVHPFLIPTMTSTIGIDAGKNVRDRIDALRHIAAEGYDGDLASMLRAFLVEGAGAADIALIARYVSDRIIATQSLRHVMVDIDALREDDDRFSYIRFANTSGAGVVFDAGEDPPERMLACIPMRCVDDMIDVVYPDGSRHRTPIARQALHLLIDALHVYEPLFLDRIYVTAARRENVPESIRASIEIRILSACDVSRTTGRVFDWDDGAPDDRPIGLAIDATVAVVREDGSEVVDVPLVGDVVLPLHGDGDEDATFPAADIVATLLDVRYLQPKRFVVFSGDITDRMVRSVRSAGDGERDAARLVARMAQAFLHGVASMLVRTDDVDEGRQRQYLTSSDVIADFPAALLEAYGWKISTDAIGRLAKAVVRYRKSNVVVHITPHALFEDAWLIRVDNVNDDSPAIVIASS